MSLERIDVSDIGSNSAGLLSTDLTASVMGVTSRGLFLYLATGWVIFLSSETYRGPLTLNCKISRDNWNRFNSRAPASISNGRIFFPESMVVFYAGQASPWQAPALPNGILSSAMRQDCLVQVTQQLPFHEPASILADVLPLLLGFAEQPNDSHSSISRLIESLRIAHKERRLPGVVHGLTDFLGLGNGLTPSGDDLAAGYLLALRRWGHVLAPDMPVEHITQELLPLAYQKTNTLAANLIECASQGQADERLLLALDGIMTGDPGPPACAAALAAWGHTSGRDALVGMALVLSCIA